jgi:hypothetical protein
MGGMGSKIESQQVLLVGLEQSGKSLFLKKLIELKKAEAEETVLEPTNGYNYVTFNYSNTTFDIWDLGGDSVSRSYWPTFYRNLKYTIVVYFVSVFDKNNHVQALKDLLVLVNQEELKTAKFFIIFNIILDDLQKMAMQDQATKEASEIAESLINSLKECPIHDYDTRVQWKVFDVSKMKEGENNTTDMLSKCLLGINK